jgi:two-component system KDP operon response regulator KdpE
VSRVLVVDDDPEITKTLSINLRARGFDVVTAADGASALRAASQLPPEFVIVDLGLPGLDGISVIEGVRGWSSVPILVLSGRSGIADKITALDAGADDYLSKPFSVEELLARMRALSRRAGDAFEPAQVRLGHVTVDLAARTVTRQSGHEGTEIHLTATEWRLLEILLRNPGKLLGRRYLLDEVWGPGSPDHSNYLRVYMARIRRKVEADPARPRYLLNEHGLGYRFEPGEEVA